MPWRTVMRNAPEFTAIAVWCLFAAAIATAQGGVSLGGRQQPAVSAPDTGPLLTGRSSAISNPSAGPYGALFIDPSLVADADAASPVMTGRSAAVFPAVGPYGALFIDHSLQETHPAPARAKPTSADLTAN